MKKFFRLTFAVFSFWRIILRIKDPREKSELIKEGYLDFHISSIIIIGFFGFSIIFAGIPLSVYYPALSFLPMLGFVLAIGHHGVLSHYVSRWIKTARDYEKLKWEYESHLRRKRAEEELERMREHMRQESEKREQKWQRDWQERLRDFEEYMRNNTHQRYAPPRQQAEPTGIGSYLKVLELPPGTRDFTTIKKQYRLLILKYHPDVYKGGDEKAKAIIEAFKYLEKVLK